MVHPTVSAILQNTSDLHRLLAKVHQTEGDKKAGGISDGSVVLCGRLHALIVGRKPNFKQPNMRQWSLDMDKLLRIEKRTPEQVADVIDWCQQDDFWQDNILSPYKLRLQLDKLEFKMEKDSKWKRDQRLRKPHSSGKTARERYLESLDKTCRIGGVEAESSTIGRGDRATN